MRMFVAVVPPSDAVEHLDEFLAPRRAAAEFRWASVEQLHLTLAFLASVPDRRLDDLIERVRAAAARRTPFAAAAHPGGGRGRVSTGTGNLVATPMKGPSCSSTS